MRGHATKNRCNKVRECTFIKLYYDYHKELALCLGCCLTDFFIVGLIRIWPEKVASIAVGLLGRA